ncbi:dCTP deaminase [Acidobacteria bacterium AH-259-O06]|nr:dCTP deaminase [Acidobacteria bacterium AH-259-O06]
MILSDKAIREALLNGIIEITPEPTEEQYDTSSLDLRLGKQFFRYKERLVEQVGVETVVDPYVFDFARMATEYMEEIPTSTQDGSVILRPGDLIFGTTLEKIHLPEESLIAARIEGRSTLARIGLSVHLTAPTIQLGFRGPLTLEIKNHGQLHIRLTPGMIICQLIFEMVGKPATGEISTKFQNQVSPIGDKAKDLL